MLKKLKKAGLLSMALLMCFSALKINQVNAQSKGAYIKGLKAKKHYYYDINNDGKKEDIYYSTDYNSYNEKIYFYLYINNKMVKYQSTDALFPDDDYDVKLYDFNKKDNYYDLVVGIDGEGYSDLSIMRYKKGKILNYKIDPGKCKRSSKFAYVLSISEKSGNGIIDFTVKDVYGLDYMLSTFTSFKYVVNNKGIYKQDTYNYEAVGLTKTHKYKAARNLNTYKKVTGSSKAFIIKKNEKVNVCNIYKSNDGKIHLYVKNSKGKYGWIRVGKNSPFSNNIGVQ